MTPRETEFGTGRMIVLNVPARKIHGGLADVVQAVEMS